MIGLSLSFCVIDILEGRVPEKDVEKIITSTKAGSSEGWEHVIETYRESYWNYSDKFSPDDAEALVRRLLAAGKIEQPRLLNPFHHPLIVSGKWVLSENQIVWSDG